MKTIIIVINVLLLSLILYNLLSKGDKVLENMTDCPTSGAAGTNKKLLNRLYQEIARTDAETDELNKTIKVSNDLATQKEKQQKAFMKNLNDQKKQTGAQMDSLPIMKPGKPIKFPKGVTGFGKLLQKMSSQGF
tara:strand:- start:2851 stop:3252 length:402 start_codon:yes stop_codon:yes gene_type:complete